jgi:hypothetical protein
MIRASIVIFVAALGLLVASAFASPDEVGVILLGSIIASVSGLTFACLSGRTRQ